MMIQEYPNVIRELNAHGCLEHLCVGQRTWLPGNLAIDLTQAICGLIPVTLERIDRSWARRGDRSIVLACNSKRRVMILSVLHESAHILDYDSSTQGALHGSAFQRIYARLLRRHVPLT